MTVDPFRLDGRVAIVTGGGAARGRHPSALAAAGATLVVAGADQGEARRVAADVNAAGGQALAVDVDIAIRPRSRP